MRDRTAERGEAELEEHGKHFPGVALRWTSSRHGFPRPFLTAWPRAAPGHAAWDNTAGEALGTNRAAARLRLAPRGRAKEAFADLCPCVATSFAWAARCSRFCSSSAGTFRPRTMDQPARTSTVRPSVF